MSGLQSQTRYASVSHILFFFNDPATTEIYTLSLHDALPILPGAPGELRRGVAEQVFRRGVDVEEDRKSTRLNSSHPSISYAVFCLKKKKKYTTVLHLSTLSLFSTCLFI